MASLSTNFWQLFLSQGICMGLGFGLIFSPVLSLMSIYFTSHRSLAVALAATGSANGGLVFPDIRVPRRKSGPIVEWSFFQEPAYLLFTIQLLGPLHRFLLHRQLVDLILSINGAGIFARTIPKYLADCFTGPLNILIPSTLLSSVLPWCWINVTDSKILYTFVPFYGAFASSTQSLFPATLATIAKDVKKVTNTAAIPRCGYCTRRRKLNCQYKSPEQCHLSAQVELSLASTSSPVIRSSLLLSYSLSDVLRSRPTNSDSTLYLQILRMMQTTGQFVDDISARYFRGIHAFVPVVSHRRIHDQLVDFGTPPPAGFSILLLSMCLITYHPEFASPVPDPLDRETLYIATKTLFAQVQVSFPPSLDLIQAGIILATYEYANGKLHDAFSSIGLCARMGYTARLHLAKPVQDMNAEVYRKAQEDANTWWGIIPLVTSVSDSDLRLPTENDFPSQSKDTVLKLPFGFADSLITSNAGGFACIAQAAWLLDQVFKALDVTEVALRHTQLNGLDHTLRTYLAVIMDQTGGKWNVYCAAIAIIIRALFILHSYTLNHISEADESMHKPSLDWSSVSHAVLDTITKVVEDIANAQSSITLLLMDMHPPSFAFDIRAALKHIHDFKTMDDEYVAAEKRLRKALELYHHRWDSHIELSLQPSAYCCLRVLPAFRRTTQTRHSRIIKDENA
ncbi:hypothetical protein UA08_03458 [Talaromyces atroroseus]|uniref:Transcription factor domain-containing protein n=1 Tax=Talaromyces atroroseus TaxID=1441469 RepID=A0A225AJA2_TALAT|nr:hypothetical protein UA08_03458 [Talaromyces atroroseus]OKL61552.1 hypothetical protein UA08_03458 [Talaromyces atroroseus]